jgi:hypothetical protein
MVPVHEGVVDAYSDSGFASGFNVLTNEIAFGALLDRVEVGELCIKITEPFVVLRRDYHVASAGGLCDFDPLFGESGLWGELAGQTLVFGPGNGFFLDGPLLAAAKAVEAVVDEEAVARFAPPLALV